MMDTLRDKIAKVVGDSHAASLRLGAAGDLWTADAIMSIIENHIEWTDPDDCEFKHVYGVGYEITNGYALYDCWGELIEEHDTLDDAKKSAQAHKELWG